MVVWCLIIRIRVELEHLLEHARFILISHSIKVVVTDSPVDSLPCLVEPVKVHSSRYGSRQEKVSKIIVRFASKVTDETFSKITIITVPN